MANTYVKASILSQEKQNDQVYLIKLKGKFTGKPGQFYMVKLPDSDLYLPRPLSICDLDKEGITFLYQRVGKGTSRMASYKKGDFLEVMGPLGQGFFPISADKKIALVGGGIGIAPFLFLAKQWKNSIDLYAGFKGEPYFLEYFKNNVDKITVATEDGSAGYKGYIIDVLEYNEYDLILCCGPNMMMKNLQKRIGDVPAQFSLESRMACGIGACLGCSVKTAKGMKRVCHEGPVFLGQEVIFDDED